MHRAAGVRAEPRASASGSAPPKTHCVPGCHIPAPAVDGYRLVGYMPSANVAGSFNISGAPGVPLISLVLLRRCQCVMPSNLYCALTPFLVRLPDRHMPPPADARAAKVEGKLVATFTADLPQSADALLGAPFPIVYAIGPLADDGSLLPHPDPKRPYGGTSLQLRGGPSGGAAAPQPARPAAAADPPGGSGGGGAVAPAPASEGATAAGCQLSIGNKQLSFAACTPVPGVGADFTLMWTLKHLGGWVETGRGQRA